MNLRKCPTATLYRNLLLIITSFILVLLLCEVVVRIFVPVRNVGPSFTLYDPIYGKRIKKNFTAKRITPEFTMQFTSNSLGYRGPEPEADFRRPIIFLGDSFTMGYGVNDGHEFPALVQKTLEKIYRKNRIPVLNTGLGDSGNGRWLKFLRIKGPKYNPRMLVLQIAKNDFDDNVREHLFGFADTGELKEFPVTRPQWGRIMQRLMESIPPLSYSYFLALMKQTPFVLTRPKKSSHPTSSSTDTPPFKETLTYRLLEDVLITCEKRNWPVLGLSVGVNGPQFYQLEKIFQGYDAQVIKVPGKKVRPDLYYRIDAHWNESGHILAAELIVERIIDSNYFR